MTSTEPKHAALRALVAATVRVGRGSGALVRREKSVVVVTAAHVLDEQGPGLVRWPGGFSDADVLHRDADVDLAVLAAPPALECFALPLLDVDQVAAGDELWTTGFPGGWAPDDGPLLCKGIVAGIAREGWIDIDASWGSSGGPLALVSADAAEVAGVALGAAGEVHEHLEALRRTLAERADTLAEYAAAMDALPSQLEAHHQRMRESFLEHELPGILTAEQKATAQSRVLSKFAQEHREKQARLEAVSLSVGVTGTVVEITRELADLIERHFRTGFVRFAGVDAIRKVLGLGS